MTALFAPARYSLAGASGASVPAVAWLPSSKPHTAIVLSARFAATAVSEPLMPLSTILVHLTEPSVEERPIMTSMV